MSRALELGSPSFNIHTWGSFLVLLIVAWKTYLSGLRKRPLYHERKWRGISIMAAWIYTWLTATVSYYLRTQPENLQSPRPVFLLLYRLLGVQLVLPFGLGGLISAVVLRRATQVGYAPAA